MTLTVSIADSWAQVRELEGAWRTLHAASGADPVFGAWEFVDAWRDASAERSPPFVIVVHDSAEVVGIAPLCRASYRFAGSIPVRVLRPFADTATAAEYPAWLIRDHRCDVAAALAGGLASRSDWDILYQPLVADWRDAWRDQAAALAAASLVCRQRPRLFAAARLPETVDEYLAAMGSRRRQQVRRHARRHAHLTLLTESDLAPDDALAALFELHARRWTAAGESGAFARQPALKRFFERYFGAAPDCAAWFALAEEGRIVAIQVGLVAGDAYYQIQEGFEPEADGLGNALRLRAIAELIDRGVREYDFLGGFTEHKRRWNAEPRQGCDLLAARAGSLASLLVRCGTWPTGRFMTRLDP